jgi:hypothetical protein
MGRAALSIVVCCLVLATPCLQKSWGDDLARSSASTELTSGTGALPATLADRLPTAESELIRGTLSIEVLTATASSFAPELAAWFESRLARAPLARTLQSQHARLQV